ncbi:Putative sodium-coupled neutral amino acid transporter 7 (Solute carrier family 38 member 7) [Durusdinium trenchii]|uniref:Sodium-coupled neutral amino acid transporter 7 (Solute carrier family 38 member 7) n=1 Tax=Durusdinium trenchii TaxID=1381693 RepID=A0ABP0JD15_9DINO
MVEASSCDTSNWVLEYRELSGSDSPFSTTPGTRRRALARDPSSENLFVDIGANPECPQSGKFLQNLIYHGSQLEPIDEAVGLAHATGAGSMFSSIFTLVASAMGAGCLSLPHMFSKAGLVLGLSLLTCGAVLAHVSLVILMSCARYTQSRSFAELVSNLQEDQLDGPVRDLSVDIVITLYGMAAVLIYMMLIGDFMSDIARSPLFDLEVPRHYVILASLTVVFPLSIPRNVTALRYISFLSISAITFLTLVVAAKTPEHLADLEGSNDSSGTSVQTVLQCFAMALFSFNAHTNAVPVALSLDQPRATRIWHVSLVSVLIELVIYATIATCGYLSFGSQTQQDFIRNYPAEDRWMLIVRCVYSVPIIFGVPMNLAPAAASMQALAGNLVAKMSTFGRQRSDSEKSSCQRICIVSFVLLFCAAVSILCDAFADVIGLFGACFGTLICLIWPLRIYLKVMKTLHSRALSTVVSMALFLAASLGMAAFVEQFYRVITFG